MYELQLHPLDLECRAMVEASPKCHSRNCIRSAFHHLEMAAKIQEIDPGMAVFRALSAEEEAATGLMHCLQELGYNNASLLQPRKHFHKNAVSPFLSVLGMFFAEFAKAHIKQPGLYIDPAESEKRLMLRFRLPFTAEDQWVTPIPPLNFSISSGGKRISFQPQIEALASKRNVSDIAKHIKREANRRNEILYAAPSGYPTHPAIGPDFFHHHQVLVVALMRAWLLIKPYPEHMCFVQDSLDAFLVMLGALKSHDLIGDIEDLDEDTSQEPPSDL